MFLKNCIIWMLLPICVVAQADETYIDNHYLEDQLYIGLQYNSLLNVKNGLENTGVPFGFEMGFIKDIPLNKKRNKGIGIGVGYSYDVLKPNLSITSSSTQEIDFTIDNSFSNYSYTAHHLEFPLEFRWRTSTAKDQSFWRCYTGASFVYQFSNQATFENQSSNSTTYKNISELTKNNFTVYTSVGFGTWNFHVKYYLKPVFTTTTKTTDGNELNFNQLKIGVMFYLL